MLIRRYNSEWEKDPLLAPWIAKVKNDNGEENVSCNFCDRVLLTPHKPNLTRHATSKTHQKNVSLQVHAAVQSLKADMELETNEITLSLVATASHMAAEMRTEISAAENNDTAEITQAVRLNSIIDQDNDTVNADCNADSPLDVSLETENNIDTRTPTQSKKRKYPEKWNENEKYAMSIRLLNDDGKVVCIHCNIPMLMCKNVIDKHLASDNHLYNIGEISSTTKWNEDVAIAEIKLAAMALDRNTSFNGLEESVKILQDIIYDSDLLKKVSLDRKKCSQIIQDVIAPAQKLRLTEILKSTQFAVLIDECTDISVHSCICITIRYTDTERKKVCDTLWDVVRSYKGDEKSKADAEYVFNEVVDTFKKAEVPTENIISFCSDTCNLMMGTCNSIATRFQALVPNIKIVKCACHLEHLVARDAMKIFPSECLQLVSSLYNYISSSSKKMHKWFVLQQKLGLDPLVILRHTPVRWLSLYLCILRILRRYTALIIFLRNEVTEKSNQQSNENTAEGILHLMEDPLMLSYFLFLEAMLSRLTRANEFLQTEKAIVPSLNNKMTEVYIEFLKMYMKEDYVDSTDVSDIDPDDYNHFKEIKDVYIGENTDNFFNSIPENCNTYQQVIEFEDDFRKTCRKFLIESCTQIKERCDLKEDRHFFNPHNVLSNKFHENHPNLDTAFEAYCHAKSCRDLDCRNKINDQWSRLIIYKFPDEILKKLMTAKYADDFWFTIKGFQESESNVYVFEELADFALTILCIPHSSATPERVWSKLKDVKTSKRSSLSFPMVRAILLAAQYIKDQGGARMFLPTPRMIEAMKMELNSRQRKSPKLQMNHALTQYGDIDLTNVIKVRCQAEELMFHKKYADMKTQDKEKRKLFDFVELLNESNNFESEKNVFDNFIDNNDNDANNIKNMNNNGPIIDILKTNNDSVDTTNVFNHLSINKQNSDESLILYKKSRLNDISECNYGMDCTNELSSIISNSIKNVINDASENVCKQLHCLDNSMVLLESDLCLEILDNGLMSNVDYYMRCKTEEYTIGMYRCINNHPIRDYRILDEDNCAPEIYTKDHRSTLWSKEYHTLQGKEFIDGDVIDAFGSVQEKHWINAIAVPTQQTKNLMVTIGEKELPSNWFMFHLQSKIHGKIFMPYEMNNHWCLFVIDVDKEILTHIDPLVEEGENIRERSRLCTSNFLKYLKHPMQKGCNSLKNIDWRYGPCRSKRKLQTDGYNCGLFVMHYMDCIGRNIDFDVAFDPNQYRQKIAKLLIIESENMQQTCLYCFSNDHELRNQGIIKCILCNRFAHKRCLIRSNDSEACIAPVYICNLCSNSSST